MTLQKKSLIPEKRVSSAVGDVGHVGVAGVVPGQRDGVAGRLAARVIVLHRPRILH